MVIQRLTGYVLEWAAVVWSTGGLPASNYAAFTQELKGFFDHPNHGESSVQRLLCLRQGDTSVADYAVHFPNVVAGSGWNESALTSVFHEGLHHNIQRELSCKDAGMDLSSCISLATKLDQLF